MERSRVQSSLAAPANKAFSQRTKIATTHRNACLRACYWHKIGTACSLDVPACSLYALGMYTITWEKTNLGGETAPGDFVAVVEGEIAGRIYPYLVGPKKGFYWTFQLGHGEFRKAHLSGIVNSKQEAADKVKAEFARWLEYPHEQGGGKDLPIKYWSPGSIAYSKVKHK